MQNRYVGDVGDFAKYSFLNAMSEGRQLGVAWYLFPDEAHNGDGSHISYLERADEWRSKDPQVFDALRAIVNSGERSVSGLQNSGALQAAVYADEVLDFTSASHTRREQWRREWFARTADRLKHCDLVFCDPDNGLYPDRRYKHCNKQMWKRQPLEEAVFLSAGRPAVFYHHNTRFVGGHEAEIRHWMQQLVASFAVRARAFSSRTFFVVNADEGMRRRAEVWCKRFGPKYELHHP
ncbi:hypothetical protein [Aliiroseovarius marinus]|uniref:hypothetical protein n=1 Tax=Aliiroseovarius marinus TaxID=2500159 RepID=UPI003D7CD93E